ncbi:inositol monophosphatase family protein [Granulicoccus phenolivorans]|uniref:inositol monophosphatase family protein n=1 Tax=Granulicoccus phenolivorans TaxID=266854 RepID=UPI00041D6AC4|nr:inositol monophosphatase family protein [Granulicoccus phenolivorans]
MSDYHDDLRLAHMLADQADALTMDRFKSQELRVSRKPDRSVVSEADLAVEETIRNTLNTARKRDAIIGEEGGRTGSGPRAWIVDPIDGTSNFVRGVPVWATLIALAEDDRVVVGVVSAPALNRRWWASLGGGAYTGRSLDRATPISVSRVARIEDASMSYSSMVGWVKTDYGQPFVDLMRACWRTRAYGDFWNYMLVAEGAVDLALEPELALHDMAACSIVVTEAGGRFTNVEGTPGPVGPGALATNGVLHDTVLQHMAGELYPALQPYDGPEN